MSTDPGKAAVEGVLEQSKALVDQAAADETRQMDFLDPVTPEDMLEARETLGPNAGNYAVLKEARRIKRGRPAGSRNRRTDDFVRYIAGFGQDPAITLMQIQSTPQEVLVENSRRVRRRRRTDRGVEVDVMQTMTYEAATALRIRCAEALMPFIHGKMPLAVDLRVTGISDLVIEGVTHSREEIANLYDGDFEDVPDDAGGAGIAPGGQDE